MNINRNNYEAFLVDYAEGNLSEEMVRAVEAFLNANSDIQNEFSLFTDSDTNTSTVSFDYKSQLKSIPLAKAEAKSDFFQQQCVAKIENQLNKKELSIFKQAVAADKNKQQELKRFEQTILLAEPIKYNEKLSLKIGDTPHVINPNNFTEYCIACHEGWLSQAGLIALNTYISENLDCKKEFDFIGQIKLNPDYSIVFPGKNNLKKFRILNSRTIRNISIAASVAALFALGYIVNQNSEFTNKIQLASTVQVESKEPQKNTLQANAKIQTKKNLPETSPITKTEKRKSSVLEIDENSVTNIREKQTIEAIEPIDINNIDCRLCDNNNVLPKQLNEIPPCKQMGYQVGDKANFSQQVVGNKTNKGVIQTNVVDETNEITKLVEPAKSKNNLFSKLLTHGYKGINRVTNGKVKIINHEDYKTSISFSSKYLAFTTNINSNKNK